MYTPFSQTLGKLGAKAAPASMKKRLLFLVLSLAAACVSAYAFGVMEHPALYAKGFGASLSALRVFLPVCIPILTLFYFALLCFLRRLHISALVLSVLFSLFLIHAYSMENSDLKEIFLPGGFLGSIPVLLGLCLLILAILETLYFLFDRWTARPVVLKATNLDDDLQILLGSVAIILTGWLPAIALCYPGSVFADTVNQIKMGLGLMKFGASNPVFVSLLYGWLFRIGSASGDERGIFLIVLFQLVVNVCAMSYLALRVRRYSNSIVPWLITVLFFAVLPTWENTAQLALKDVLHTGFFILFVVDYLRCLPDAKAKRRITRADILRLGVSAALVMLTRKGTVYLVALSLAVICLVNRRTLLLSCLGCVGAVVALFVVLNQFVYPKMDIAPERKVENYSLPLQQMAYFLRVKGDVLTQEEYEIVNETADYQGMIDAYTPMISDPVKLTFHGEQQSNERFFRLYRSLFLRYPGIFLKSLIMNVFEHFNPFYKNVSIRVFIQDAPELYHASFAHDAAKYKLSLYWGAWRDIPVLRMFMGNGLYIWINLLLLGYACSRRAWSALLGLLPALTLIFGLLLSHVNGEVRYGYPVIAVTPLLLVYTMYRLRGSAAEAPVGARPNTAAASARNVLDELYKD